MAKSGRESSQKVATDSDNSLLRQLFGAKHLNADDEMMLRDAFKKKLRDYLGIFPNIGGGGLLNSQNFCKFTKSFLVCQNHSEVLKHVLQWGGGDI